MSSTLKVDILQDSGGNNLVTSNGSGVITAAGFGKVGQVKSFTLDSAVSFSGTTFVDTTLGVDITPSSTSSKILVWGHIGTSCDSSASIAFFQLRRNDTTSIGGHETVANKILSHASFYGGDTSLVTENVFANIGFGHLDSPNTTSSTNYSIYGRGLSSYTMYLNRTAADRDNTDSRTVSMITAMEILP